ncbi:MAG: hypothetical protein DRO40_11425 [Thermoprotei archaeon]|nr:MAG: hypothetical protein DRO40_11425 [Thermoprotei archaeon]
MPREVRVLAVEDKPWWMQPLFSFPFKGDLSVRQLLIAMLFIIPVVALSIIADLGFMKSFSSLLVMLFIGLGIAKKPVNQFFRRSSFSYPKRKVQASGPGLES